MRSDPAAGGADEHGLQGAGQRSAAAERFALSEDGGDGFEELAAAGRGQRAQGGEVAGEPQGLGGLAGARGVPGATQFPAEPGDGDGGGLADPVGVTTGFEDGLLPTGVPDPGGVTGTGVEQVEGVRHEGGDGRGRARGRRPGGGGPAVPGARNDLVRPEGRDCVGAVGGAVAGSRTGIAAGTRARARAGGEASARA